MTKDEELAKHIAQIEQYKEQINSLEIQSSFIQSTIVDYSKAKMTLEKLGKIDKNSDILIPVGGSTYVNATAADTSKVLFDIGGGIVTEKNFEDAIKKIDERVEDLQKTQDYITSMMQQIQTETADVTEKAQKLYTEQQG